MKLFRDMPPPDPDLGFAGNIDWAAQRDPVGHRVHLVIAMIGLALIPLSSSLATIGSTPLFVYAAMRAPTIHRCWRGILAVPSILLLVLLFAWLAISITWSADPDQGVRLMRGSRYLLLVPALLPLMRHAPLLLGSMCAGVFLQNTVQFVMYFSRTDYFGGGLDGHPGAASLWFILATGILLTIPDPGRRPRTLQRAGSIIPVLGVIVAAARSTLLGMAGALVALVGWALLRRPSGWKTIASFGSIGLLLLVLSTTVPGSMMSERMSSAWNDAGANIPVATDQAESAPSVEGTRLEWWRIGVASWKKAPLIGQGIASAEREIASDPRIVEITRDERAGYYLRNDYHSLFVTILADGGLVGAALLLGWLATLGLQIRKTGVIAPALYAGLIGYLGYSCFNTTLFSGRVLAVAIVIMAFSTHVLPESRTLREATRDPEE